MSLKFEKVLEKEVEKVNEHIYNILISKCDEPKLVEIMEWILKSKGKQIRPKLAILCSRFCKSPKDVTEHAASVEILHMSSLVHDDVIDNAEIRRGDLSVQKKFGREIAIYAGDYMILALFSNTTYKPSFRQRSYMSLITRLCSGELSQHYNLFNKEINEDQYLKNIENKTAVLFEAACMIGATEGGCSKKRVKILSEFGKNLGMMFQIRDDLLDYMSTDDQEGKPTSSDILSGVYTLPLIVALGGKNRKSVKEAIDNYIKNPIESNIKTIIEYIKSEKGFEAALSKLEQYRQKAINSLNQLPDCDEKVQMEKIVEYVSTVPNMIYA